MFQNTNEPQQQKDVFNYGAIKDSGGRIDVKAKVDRSCLKYKILAHFITYVLNEEQIRDAGFNYNAGEHGLSHLGKKNIPSAVFTSQNFGGQNVEQANKTIKEAQKENSLFCLLSAIISSNDVSFDNNNLGAEAVCGDAIVVSDDPQSQGSKIGVKPEAFEKIVKQLKELYPKDQLVNKIISTAEAIIGKQRRREDNTPEKQELENIRESIIKYFTQKIEVKSVASGIKKTSYVDIETGEENVINYKIGDKLTLESKDFIVAPIIPGNQPNLGTHNSLIGYYLKEVQSGVYKRYYLNLQTGTVIETDDKDIAALHHTDKIKIFKDGEWLGEECDCMVWRKGGDDNMLTFAFSNHLGETTICSPVSQYEMKFVNLSKKYANSTEAALWQDEARKAATELLRQLHEDWTKLAEIERHKYDNNTANLPDDDTIKSNDKDINDRYDKLFSRIFGEKHRFFPGTRNWRDFFQLQRHAVPLNDMKIMLKDIQKYGVTASVVYRSRKLLRLDTVLRKFLGTYDQYYYKNGEVTEHKSFHTKPAQFDSVSVHFEAIQHNGDLQQLGPITSPIFIPLNGRDYNPRCRKMFMKCYSGKTFNDELQAMNTLTDPDRRQQNEHFDLINKSINDSGYYIDPAFSANRAKQEIKQREEWQKKLNTPENKKKVAEIVAKKEVKRKQDDEINKKKIEEQKRVAAEKELQSAINDLNKIEEKNIFQRFLHWLFGSFGSDYKTYRNAVRKVMQLNARQPMRMEQASQMNQAIRNAADKLAIAVPSKLKFRIINLNDANKKKDKTRDGK